MGKAKTVLKKSRAHVYITREATFPLTRERGLLFLKQ